ncbi:hypothetical protein ABT025_04610 [Streptomyces sp. NPDC002809]|uniref:hypothetical protein n=1 Tax=Streptomyces sp. NPDC002809 TaxID=3154433 RepID=UPI003317DF6C
MTAWLALSCLPLLTVGSCAEPGLVPAVTGPAVPPVLVLSSVLTAASVDRAAPTQAFTLLNSASAAGSAGAERCPVARWTPGGAHHGFAIAAAATAAMAVLATARARAAWGRYIVSGLPAHRSTR